MSFSIILPYFLQLETETSKENAKNAELEGRKLELRIGEIFFSNRQKQSNTCQGFCTIYIMS